MLQRWNATRCTTNLPGVLCQTATTVSKSFQMWTPHVAACHANHNHTNCVTISWEEVTPRPGLQGPNVARAGRSCAGSCWEQKSCETTLSEQQRACLIGKYLFRLPNWTCTFFLFLDFSSELTERIFEAPFHQNTCFECFLEVLVSFNVFAVLVLVGLVMRVVYMTNIWNKKARDNEGHRWTQYQHFDSQVWRMHS